MLYVSMFHTIHTRFFLVALFFVSFVVIFESLLAEEPSSNRCTPLNTIDVPNCDAPIDTVDYTSVLLRAILDASHSREWIVKGVLRWLTFCQWAFVGMIALRFHHIEQPNLAAEPRKQGKVINAPATGLFIAAQHLSSLAARLMYATRARIGLLVPATFMPAPPIARVIPPRLLVTYSSAGLQLSPMTELRFRRHARSTSRVAEIAM